MTDDRDDDPTIQIDVYGIKANASPRDAGEPSPKDWAEVGAKINEHLKNLAVGIFGLLDDTVRGSRNLVRGIANIPVVVRSKIANAHDIADREETELQDEHRKTPIAQSSETAAAHLLDVLKTIAQNGVEVKLHRLPKDVWAISLTPKDDPATVAEALRLCVMDDSQRNIADLTLKQAKELSDYLKDVHGIEPAVRVVLTQSGEPAVEGQTKFDVILTGFGDKKLDVIKVVKNLSGVSLMEAKKMVEACPFTLKEAASKEEAIKIKAELEEAGGIAELK